MLLLCDRFAFALKLMVLNLKELEEILARNEDVVCVAVAERDLQHPDNILILRQDRLAVSGS